MTRSEILYLLPYLGSLALSLGVFYYAWQRRQTKGVTAYLWYVAGQTLWVFGFIADVWDALSSDRPCRKAWSMEQVAQYLLNESGKHFDPHMVNKFLEMMEKGEI